MMWSKNTLPGNSFKMMIQVEQNKVHALTGFMFIKMYLFKNVLDKNIRVKVSVMYSEPNSIL